VNRGGPLERRTPLARTGRIRRASIRRSGDARRRTDIRAEVYQRDHYRCILLGHDVGCLGACHGDPLTPHHLQKASQGGPYSPSNLVTLCAGHNGRVEDFPMVSHTLGLVVWSGETVDLAWQRLRDRGYIL
jgi:5-methylcytosine-specific restriction endonuclease McrA